MLKQTKRVRNGRASRTYLRDEVVALVAPDTINVATSGLVASSVSSLLGHSELI